MNCPVPLRHSLVHVLSGVTLFLALGVGNVASAAAAGNADTSAAPIASSTGSESPNTNLYYYEADLSLSNRIPLTALTVTITVQKSHNIANPRSYDTIGTLHRTVSDNGGIYTFTYTLPAGQTVPAGSNRILAAQVDFLQGAGNTHDYTADHYTVSAMSADGTTYTDSGGFFHSTDQGGGTPPASTATSTPTTATPTATGTPLPTATTTATPTPTAQNTAVTASGRAQAGNPSTGEDDVVITNTAPITALTIHIFIPDRPQMAVNDPPNGTLANVRSYDTFGNLIRTVSHTGTHYPPYDAQFTLPAGQTVSPGTMRIAAAQFDFLNGTGTQHNYGLDSYSINGTTADGTPFSLNGRF